MKLGTKGRYAVMALVDLAVHSKDQPTVIADIAVRQNISPSYLEQLFARLRRSGLVNSIRGQAGGYFLARTPSEISISDIFQAVGEPIQTTACKPGGPKGCSATGSLCLTHNLWAGLSVVMDDYLSEMTLAHVCGETQSEVVSNRHQQQVAS